MKTQLLKPILLAAAIFALAGCTSFESKWAAAVRLPSLASDPQGAWIGSWQNTNNSHGGALRAILEPRSATRYVATFHATWGDQSGSFTTQLKGTRAGNTLTFEGRKRLLGFLIRNAGQVSPTNFASTYESRFDTGTFTLRRPE
jgi:hypothetical protein